MGFWKIERPPSLARRSHGAATTEEVGFVSLSGTEPAKGTALILRSVIADQSLKTRIVSQRVPNRV